MNKIDVLKQMTEIDSTNGLAWYLLGMEYIENCMDPESLMAFSNALTYSDDTIKEQVLLALNSVACKQTEEPPKEKEDDNDNIVSLKVVRGEKMKGHASGRIEVVKVTFDDVGGLSDLKKIIQMKIIKPFVNPSLFNKFKKKTGGGILLYGPPGCGKTFIAKATAGECHANFRPVHITDVLDPYLGVSARNVKDIFSDARTKKPCVMFFDEIDTICYNRSRLSSEHMRPIVDQLLSEIEGIDTSTDELLIIGATNTPWDVDSAFKRPGRFDKMIFVAPPDVEAREAIFRLKLEGKPTDGIDLRLLAQKTEFYSGADIENVVDIATDSVIQEIMVTEKERNIRMKDLINAVNETNPTTLEWLNSIKNYIKYANQSGVYDDVKAYLKKYKRL